MFQFSSLIGQQSFIGLTVSSGIQICPDETAFGAFGASERGQDVVVGGRVRRCLIVIIIAGCVHHKFHAG